MENEEKKKEWEEAINLNQVDGNAPSKELQELIEKNIKGEVSKEEMIEELKEQSLKKK